MYSVGVVTTLKDPNTDVTHVVGVISDMPAEHAKDVSLSLARELEGVEEISEVDFDHDAEANTLTIAIATSEIADEIETWMQTLALVTHPDELKPEGYVH